MSHISHSRVLSRGGAGISKVVRPLQIKVHSCMWKERGVYNRQCAAVKLLVESKCVGADAVWSGRTGAPDPPTKEWERLYEKLIHAGQWRACMGHLAQLSRPQSDSDCLCSLRMQPTTS